MPFPYNIIFGRDTALPCPLYHSGVTEINITYLQALKLLAKNRSEKCDI
jgi:hypothetical protein